MKKSTRKHTAVIFVVLILAVYVGGSGPLAGMAYRRTNAVNGLYWYEQHENFYRPLIWFCQHTGTEKLLDAYWKTWDWSDVVDTG